MENNNLIEILSTCAIVCSNCASQCLAEKEVNMLSNCIKIDLDCADICQLIAKLLGRDSKHGYHLLSECREICLACAEECEKHTHMEHCANCAKICRDCAEACAEEIAQ